MFAGKNDTYMKEPLFNIRNKRYQTKYLNYFNLQTYGFDYHHNPIVNARLAQKNCEKNCCFLKGSHTKEETYILIGILEYNKWALMYN